MQFPDEVTLTKRVLKETGNPTHIPVADEIEYFCNQGVPVSVID